MIDLKHCRGCHDDFYNPGCWMRKKGKMVWRIAIGHWENPPYLNKKKKRVPNCWHGSGNQRIHYIDPEKSLDSRGFWKY